MDLIEIGWTGKPHGLKGEIKLRISDFYEDDLFAAKSLLIGDPPVPFFVEQLRAGGAVIGKFETLDSREAVSLLAGKPIWLMASQVIAVKEPEPATPWEGVVGFSIRAEGYPLLGPITSIMDLPEHYLAEMKHDGKTILVPLHEDLISGVEEDAKVLEMVLPEGLLDLA